MPMPLQLTTPPSTEPVTLAEAKAHLKVDTTDDDTLISSLIAAARARAEWHTHRAFIAQGWTLWRDAWPANGIFEIPLSPLQSVTAVTSYALDDAATIFDTSTYLVDTASEPARIAFDCDTAPSNLRRINAIAIAFTAGYGAATTDVPEPIRRAILAIVADLYIHRGDDTPTPDTALALLAPYRVLNL